MTLCERQYGCEIGSERKNMMVLVTEIVNNCRLVARCLKKKLGSCVLRLGN